MRKWNHKSVIQLMEESGNNDPLKEIKNRARDLVLEAFEMGWDGPPFSPIKLAQLLLINITPSDAIVDARIVPIGDSFQIQYNPFQKPTRTNFSIAHEIAHTLFSDCGEKIRNREQEPDDNKQLEQLCNAAAAEIQLPYAVFSNDANATEFSLDGLIALAGKYKASLESVLLRFPEVVTKPCAIMIGRFVSDDVVSIDYVKGSASFPISFPSNFEIPNNSKIYECISPGWSAREIVNWQQLSSETLSLQAVGISPYRKDNRPRVGILVSLSDLSNVPESYHIVMEYGDATKPRSTGKKIIAQVVNTSGGLGIGFGKALAKNYPIVETELKRWQGDKQRFQLGKSNLVEVTKSLYVFQMLAQHGMYTSKAGEIPLRYNHLKNCLKDLAIEAKHIGATVHMPLIGAGQAKGDWNIIIGMIHEELVSQKVNVNIYILPGKPFVATKQSNLTTFKEQSTWETGKLF